MRPCAAERHVRPRARAQTPRRGADAKAPLLPRARIPCSGPEEAFRDGGERRALSRDVERGLLHRLRQGVHVDRVAWDGLPPEGRHEVLMRALAAVAPVPPVFSHWSAAVLHGLPDDRRFLGRFHVLSEDPARRGIDGVADHLLPITDAETTEMRGLRVTTIPRTVVDVATARPAEDSVVLADAALCAGVPREDLDLAVDLAQGRRGARRAGEVVAFAHPGGESAGESRSRWTMFRLGLAPQELQREFFDERGFVARTDTWSREHRVAGEADGAKKYLDPALASQGAGRAVYEEKLREDRLRRQAAGVARWGWRESGSPALLLPVLAAAGLRPAAHRPTLQDWAREAHEARPRGVVRR